MTNEISYKVIAKCLCCNSYEETLESCKDKEEALECVIDKKDCTCCPLCGNRADVMLVTHATLLPKATLSWSR